MALRKDGELDRRAFSSKVNAQLAGRPKLFATKLSQAIVRVAEEHADELAIALVDGALGKSNAVINVPAMKELFDRGLGRALQNVDVTSDGKALPTPIILTSAPDEVSSDDSAQETVSAS